jgi:hypothetical protein
VGNPGVESLPGDDINRHLSKEGFSKRLSSTARIGLAPPRLRKLAKLVLLMQA